MVIALAIAKLIFHVLTNGQYGFHRDELATLSDARHLAWGYVAYPPLTPFIGRIALTLFGTSLTGFRFFAVLAQCIAIVITGRIACRLGGNRAAMFIAAAAAAIAPISIAASALFQYVSFDYLWFVLMAYVVVRLVDSNDPRWWLAIGACIGLGVETKYTVAFFVAGLVAGVFATPLRAHLRSKWLWIGAALSIVIALPNLIWQVQHDFISFEFLRSIHERDVRIGRTSGFVPEQFFVAVNPVTVPLWILGLYALLRDRRNRVLAYMAIVPFILFFIAHGRGYYMGPIYPMLFAAGAVELTSRIKRPIAYAAIAGVFVIGSGVALFVLPLAPIGSPLFRFATRHNGDLVEEIGWPELTAEVARIYGTIPPAERARTGIYCGNYGEAGAIDLYGGAYGLPPAISGINSYWLRGPGNPPPQTLIVVGGNRERLESRFTSVVLAGHTPNPYRIENEETRDHPDIFICRGLREPVAKLWPRLRSFG
jgi:4-amino-4-deoxy-L-arabinose transferase-like glycosyltransferase